MMRNPHSRAVRLAGAVCCLLAASCAQQQQRPAESLHRKTGTVHRVKAPITIDGVIDPAEWGPAQKLSGFWMLPDPATGRVARPTHDTTARFLWDQKYLYFALEMDDADVYGIFTKRDDLVLREDVVEMFLKPMPDRHEYYEFEINAKAAVFDLFYPRRFARNDHYAQRFNSKLQVAARVHGTLNHYADTDQGWVVEGKIPFSDFRPPLTAAPRVGDRWQAQIARYDWGVDLENTELSTWSPHQDFVNGFHRIEDYGGLIFAE